MSDFEDEGEIGLSLAQIGGRMKAGVDGDATVQNPQVVTKECDYNKLWSGDAHGEGE